MSAEKLRLKSKKLSSGRFQINFSTEGMAEEFYGYLLVEPSTSVTTVVEKINRHIKAMADSERYLQRNLYSFGNRQTTSGRILIFKNPRPSHLSWDVRLRNGDLVRTKS
jgi:hypothetical protein